MVASPSALDNKRNINKHNIIKHKINKHKVNKNKINKNIIKLSTTHDEETLFVWAYNLSNTYFHQF